MHYKLSNSQNKNGYGEYSVAKLLRQQHAVIKTCHIVFFTNNTKNLFSHLEHHDRVEYTIVIRQLKVQYTFIRNEGIISGLQATCRFCAFIFLSRLFFYISAHCSSFDIMCPLLNVYAMVMVVFVLPVYIYFYFSFKVLLL